ncbi:MAG: late competence development ComFB family protein [Spirochaetaceae bacterium]|nr:late competence development ComFB family protein [Spirochaetaceae bacterium]
MNVHNLMEEKVFKHVNDFYDQMKNQNVSWLSCDCEHCRLDTASYVLNRIPPKYVVSGRGVSHNVSTDDTQLKADIDALVIEGIQAISNARRPYHAQKNNKNTDNSENPAYNFPTFIGAVYDGGTFEPIAGAKVVLKQNNELCEMVDYTWQNPNTTSALTKGVFSFWVKPICAEKSGENQVFNFTIEVSADGFETISYDFSVPLVSDSQPQRALNSTYSLKVQDFYLFPVGFDNSMDD